MSELKTDLASVLADLVAEFADDETGELADVEFARVRRMIQANLDINDGPGSRNPVDIADFIYWHSEPASISAATRWVESLTATEVARLGLGEVLGALHPGCDDDFEDQADENEREKNAEQARATAAAIVDAAIVSLKDLNECQLSGDDSELANLWEELCVQVQGEQSFFWDAYVETIDSILVPAVEAIEPVARHALWLETDGGWDWHYDHKDEVGTLIYNADDIVIYLRNQLLTAAGNFENSAIRRYRER